MYTKILLAYDGSQGADKALETATSLCKLTGAELAVLTVYRHHSVLEASLSMVRGAGEKAGSLDDAMRSASREAAEHAKKWAIEQGVASVHAYIKGGQPSRTIVTFAKDHGCDLIVIGSRGLGASESYMLGSVSHKVTSISMVPILVV
ncbi:universal stress protein [Chachezhania antarctica]|uniref:universal stress protein n=1 Tax=Chachezhania antarctica TaxID=2340860 RepID=UPI000EAD43C1|nr:universal stress protein [Chachezhania antarctica]|tara:strand:+ start:14568 stop:15011 length:444 start_codon:yes stop_codon:yes gene_type:complete